MKKNNLILKFFIVYLVFSVQITRCFTDLEKVHEEIQEEEQKLLALKNTYADLLQWENKNCPSSNVSKGFYALEVSEVEYNLQRLKLKRAWYSFKKKYVPG